MNEGMTDKQYDGLLIEQLEDLEDMLEVAKEEKAVKTQALIEKAIRKIKQKLTTN